MSDDTIITSYLPTYRSPPEPVKCIDWMAAELKHFGNAINREGLEVDIRHIYKFGQEALYGGTLESIAKRYIIQHPEMLEIDDATFKRGYAKSMLYALSREARQRGRLDMAITSGMIDSLQPPDDLLDFEYILCSLRVNVQELLKAVRTSHHNLKQHIQKRASDRRYKFMHNRQLRDYKYWLNPVNWVGFSAGFIVDYYLYQYLPMCYRHAMWTLPQRSYDGTNTITDYIGINANLCYAFKDPVLAREIAKAYFPVRPVYLSAYTVIHTPLDPEFESKLTEILADPIAYKQRLEHEKQEAAERQQRQVLQSRQEAVTGGTDQYPRIQLDHVADRIITHHQPTVTVATTVPVYGEDGSVIGTRPITPDEARAELERLLRELRT